MKTNQAKLWEGSFGDEYTSRNSSESLVASNVHFFSKVLSHTRGSVESVLELGSNSGRNFLALRALIPEVGYTGVEINLNALNELKSFGSPNVTAIHSSIEDYQPEPESTDLVFTKGVLIHLNPTSLIATYRKIYEASKRWILIAEYFNPSPEEILYRGESGALFRRDWASDMMAEFQGLELVSFGFEYSKGPAPQDNITWFLMEKPRR